MANLNGSLNNLKDIEPLALLKSGTMQIEVKNCILLPKVKPSDTILQLVSVSTWTLFPTPTSQCTQLCRIHLQSEYLFFRTVLC